MIGYLSDKKKCIDVGCKRHHAFEKIRNQELFASFYGGIFDERTFCTFINVRNSCV